MKRVVVGLAVLCVALVLFAVARAAAISSKQMSIAAVPRLAFDEAQAAERLAGAIRFATVSGVDGGMDAEFAGLHAYLSSTWPKAHEQLAREEVGQSLLYTWKGTDAAAAPIVLMAHQDVVPVDPTTLDKWSQPPFSGKVAGGFVWGRGALDDKAALCAIFEAVSGLLAEGFTPRRTVYLVADHDEEVHGTGATTIVDLFAARSIKPQWVLDEGSGITDGVVKGLKLKAALIAVGEKGFFTVELKVEGEGGHSSMPPKQTQAGILAAAVAKLEASPFPASFDGPVGQFFDTLGPEMPFGPKLVLTNRWLFGPVLKRQMLSIPATAAALRTTTAVTMLSSGVKDNVLPSTAWAAVNFRIQSGETRETVLARVKEVIDDPRVGVTGREATLSSDPSPVSPVDAEGYRLIEKTIRGVFPETLVAPNISNGASDSRFFTRLCPQVYRFVPMVLRAEDLPRIHGIDERLSVEGYADMVRFYRQLLKDAQAD